MKQNQNNSWKFFFIASFTFAIAGVVGFFSKEESDKVAFLISALLVAIGNIIIAYKVAGNKDIKDNDRIKHKKKRFYEENRSYLLIRMFWLNYCLFCTGIMYFFYHFILLVKDGFQREKIISLSIILLITFGLSSLGYISGLQYQKKIEKRCAEELKEYKEKWEKEKRGSSTNKEEE